MNRIAYILLLLIVPSISNDDTSIKDLNSEKEKIEYEIKEKNRAIKDLNTDLKRIEKKILSTTNELNNATEKAIEGQKDLINIEEQISRNKKIVRSIDNYKTNRKNFITRKSD